MSKQSQHGFTIPEFFIAATLLIMVGMFVYSQWQYTAMSSRDTERKTSTNAIHFYLTEVYLPKHKTFPVALSPQITEGLDPSALRDPNGRLVGDPAVDIRYEASGCTGTTCTHYTLRTNLEKEADFIRRSSAD